MVAVGGVLVAIAWIINSYADSCAILYLGAGITGIGAGAVYATCVGNAVKWFPDRRGLAVGLTAAGFGAGAALTIIPIRAIIAADGYAAAFFWFGMIQGAIVFLFGVADARSAARRDPDHRAGPGHPDTRSYTPREVLRLAGILGALRNVCAGFRERAHGDGSDRADRAGLQRRGYRVVVGAARR